MPFDATASYRTGSARGPAAIHAASAQVDDADPHLGDLMRVRACMLEIDESIARLSDQARRMVNRLATAARDDRADTLREIDDIGERVRDTVRTGVERVLADGRVPGVIGGEHSVSLGAIDACANAHPGLGVLQIDAHMDLREAYQGLRHSHASVMRSVLDELQGVSTLVQLGIRDFAQEELDAARQASDRVLTVFDHPDGLGPDLIARARDGLPERIYITLDIDGLDPSLCPDTGTPVPGGITWRELMALLVAIQRSGKRVVGFDLVEVSPAPSERGVPLHEDWNAIVGARVLQRLCALTGRDAPR